VCGGKFTARRVMQFVCSPACEERNEEIHQAMIAVMRTNNDHDADQEKKV
jgi:hypothetical protein